MQLPASSATADVADLPVLHRCLKWHDGLIRQLNGTQVGIQEGTAITV